MKMRSLFIALLFLAAGQLVSAQENPFTAHNDEYTTSWDNILSVPAPGLLVNDEFDSSQNFTAHLAIEPTIGTVVVDADGGFTFTPAPDAAGPITFVYGLRAVNGNESYAVVTVEVTEGNKAPLAIDDYYSTLNTRRLEVPAPGVLANDLDMEGDQLTAELLGGPSTGIMVMQEDGSFWYAPHPNYSGRYNIRYRVTDEHGATSEGYIRLTSISSAAPVAVPDEYEVQAGQMTPLHVVGNDYDPNNNPLYLDRATQPSIGSLVTDHRGYALFTAGPEERGTTQFSYTISDGVLESTTTVTLHIVGDNEAPVVQNETAHVPLERVINPYNVLANDIDPDGDELTVSRFTVDQSDYLNIWLNDDNQTFGFQVFRPGTYTVNYWVTDGSIEVPGVLTITVDGPTENIARDDYYRFPIGTSLTLNTFANDVYFEHDRNTAPEHTSAIPGMLTYHDGNFHYFASAPVTGQFQFTYTLPGGSTATVTLDIFEP
ncbi:Ig-like domain-containing protein [Acanthopleuribacter pedis]|uniref:Tandem-95 repeat protein n=1 Tax=Acanthopleuribacter pedis TaxID=442870 RepID=A0A8J7QGC8_9BACT|nr:Ig-like domain-containing protein [Acanthopleuribacter pedis]MBO1319565.1 tandem-95 repeat protein [Acanthopleuribacter pedis]